MASVRGQRAARWAAASAAAVLVVVTPALLGAARQPPVSLTPGQVVSAAARSAAVAHSGLVQVDGRLGLPTLPFANQASAQLDQSTRVRTWWVSAYAWRTDTLAATGQQTEFATTRAVLHADYESNTVQIEPTTADLRLPRTADLMPPDAARTLLAWRSSADPLTALPARVIAGRDASGARVTSGETSSSVAALDVWVDDAMGLPLEVDLYARGNAVPAFRTRFLDVSLAEPAAAVVAPVLSDTAHWSLQRRDLLSLIEVRGSTVFPPALAGMPALGVAGLPAGVGSYGTGFARVAAVELPDRLVPRIQEAVGSGTLEVGSGRAAVLRSPLLQVAVLETADGRAYLLAGTLRSDAMDAVVRSALASLSPRAAA